MSEEEGEFPNPEIVTVGDDIAMMLGENTSHCQPAAQQKGIGDFPGGPVAKTPRSQSRGSQFPPWSGN